MYYQKPILSISGPQFLPKTLVPATGLTFDEIEEIGGCLYAQLNPPSTIENRKTVIWLLRKIYPYLAAIRKCGGEDIELNIAYYHDGQCNCSLTQEEVRLLAKVGAHFVFSVYEDCELVAAYERGEVV